MKVGDKVACKNGTSWGSHFSVETIDRETKTQWILSNGKRYKKDSLREIGNHYGRISKLTDKILNNIKLKKKLSQASVLMDNLGSQRNHIETKDIKDIGIAIGKMHEIKKLLKVT